MNKIFVNICAYRDNFLELTLLSLLDKESGRNQITYGIFEQNRLEDSLLTVNPTLATHPRVKYKRIDPEYSDGVVWARNINSLQIDDEDFLYQIDSHMIFDQDWDNFLILDYNLASKKENTKKIILTSSTKNFDFRENVVTKFVIKDSDVTCDIKYYHFHKDLKLKAHGVWKPSTKEIQKVKHIFAGNFFTTTDWVNEVGYKTNLYFEGEEQIMTLSSYVAGYKLYAQRKIKAYHYVYPEKLKTKPHAKPIINQEKVSLLEDRSRKYLIDYIYSIDEDILEQFSQEMGVDYINRKIDSNTHLAFAINK